MNKEEAIKRIRDFGLYHAIEDLPHSTKTVEAFEMAIQALEDPERTKGKWKQGYCSECGYNWGKDAPIANVPNFCPNCGAKMKQEITANIKDDDISWTDLRWYLSKEEKEYD